MKTRMFLAYQLLKNLDQFKIFSHCAIGLAIYV